MPNTYRQGADGQKVTATSILNTAATPGTAAEMAADAAAIILAGTEVANQNKRWENTTDGLIYDFRPVSGTWGYYPETNADASGKIPVSGARFIPSSYDANLTMDATGEALLLAADVKLGQGAVQVTNLGATTEAVRVAFGTSEVNALANLNIVGGAVTTGNYLPAIADGGSLASVVFGVPATALYIAAGPATAGHTQDVAFSQGK